MYYGPIKLCTNIHDVKEVRQDWNIDWEKINKPKIELEEKICKAILRKYGYPHGVIKEYHGTKEKYVREESGLVLCEIELHIGLNRSGWNFKISEGLKEFIE